MVLKRLPKTRRFRSLITCEMDALVFQIFNVNSKFVYITSNIVADYQGRHTTQAFMLHDPVDQLIVVAFRGTEFFDADAWSTDLDISWYDYRCIGKVHGGFMKALGLTPEGFPDKEPELDAPYPLAYYTLRNQLRDLVKDTNNMKFIVTGHSLGGALAILFAAILALHKEDLLLERLQGVYTFGQPRVGDKDFQGFMEKQMKNHKIKYQRIMLTEEPNKNYFAPKEAIFKYPVAAWELIRSFIIPNVEGWE
ncbi:putative triacylglycerol lipase [Rosa chinensis]|uniref:Putative triacylglycerol lipase n=1 Tax=Rosa chinensis TaxID=74649 RepID=A0A2P6RNM9_ROSCH|nr:putative triacylglycerol lipase [Rosa chinensis]